jgi:hypothetical protein
MQQYLNHPSPCFIKAKLLARYDINKEKYYDLEDKTKLFKKWLSTHEITDKNYQETVWALDYAGRCMQLILEDNLCIVAELRGKKSA